MASSKTAVRSDLPSAAAASASQLPPQNTDPAAALAATLGLQLPHACELLAAAGGNPDVAAALYLDSDQQVTETVAVDPTPDAKPAAAPAPAQEASSVMEVEPMYVNSTGAKANSASIRASVEKSLSQACVHHEDPGASTTVSSC